VRLLCPIRTNTGEHRAKKREDAREVGGLVGTRSAAPLFKYYQALLLEWSEIRVSAAVAQLGRLMMGSEASLAVKRTVIEPLVWRAAFRFIHDRTSTQAQSRPGFAQWRRPSLVTQFQAINLSNLFLTELSTEKFPIRG
jgi:hypothetical protein